MESSSSSNEILMIKHSWLNKFDRNRPVSTDNAILKHLNTIQAPTDTGRQRKIQFSIPCFLMRKFSLNGLSNHQTLLNIQQSERFSITALVRHCPVEPEKATRSSLCCVLFSPTLLVARYVYAVLMRIRRFPICLRVFCVDCCWCWLYRHTAMFVFTCVCVCMCVDACGTCVSFQTSNPMNTMQNSLIHCSKCARCVCWCCGPSHCIHIHKHAHT